MAMLISGTYGDNAECTELKTMLSQIFMKTGVSPDVKIQEGVIGSTGRFDASKHIPDVIFTFSFTKANASSKFRDGLNALVAALAEQPDAGGEHYFASIVTQPSDTASALKSTGIGQTKIQPKADVVVKIDAETMKRIVASTPIDQAVDVFKGGFQGQCAGVS
ncbi:MAG: hypothetical protein ACKVOE_10975 [Rickettsiales bacterium]